MGSRVLVGLAVVALLSGCSRPYVSPIPPPPHRLHVIASYEATWRALIQALALENVPLRVVAKDSGVIASDDFPTPIGVYADCGRCGGDRVEGEVLVTFTVFVHSTEADRTEVQINTQMRSRAERKGCPRRLRREAVFRCASTGRWEANLLDAVRRLVREETGARRGATARPRFVEPKADGEASKARQ